MGLDLELSVVVIVGLAVLAGSVVQGSAGFGVSLLGVPVLMLLDSTLMPGSMLIVGTLLPLFTVAREGRHVDWRTAWAAMLGRLLGTAGGVWVLAVLSTRALSIGLGLFILVGVALSLRNVVVPMNTATLFGAGAVTGVTGTAVSVSGPVVGLVMQHMSGIAMRATMAVFFSVGTVFSLGGLAFADALPWRQVVMGLSMLPFLTTGYLLSGPLRRYLDRGWTRPAVLAVSTFAAVGVLVRALFWT
ncbi:MAG TPA: sulfite exporter TauE/SafE family protein [Actinopolymorphaceae bacterium]